MREHIQNRSEPAYNILSFGIWLHNQGKAEATVYTNTKRLEGLEKRCNINNPDEVKAVIADSKTQNSTKKVTVNAYDNYCKYKHIQWNKPKYKAKNKIPFIPTEEEIDQLIASVSQRLATLLQILKETGARIGEIAQTKWTNIDFKRKTINITAEKGSNPRILSLSDKCLNMINKLPHKRQTIFNPKTNELRNSLAYGRNRASEKLSNPQLRRIHFHTLRHWKGTTEYHKTHDIFHVKQILGHKAITSTQIYINLENAIFNASTSEYHTATAKTIDEATKLIQVGFEYVTDLEGTKLFRKRK